MEPLRENALEAVRGDRLEKLLAVVCCRNRSCAVGGEFCSANGAWASPALGTTRGLPRDDAGERDVPEPDVICAAPLRLGLQRIGQCLANAVVLQQHVRATVDPCQHVGARR